MTIPLVPGDPLGTDAMRQKEDMLATILECSCAATVMGGGNWGAYTEHERGCPHTA